MKPGTALITRPLGEAESTARLLAARGWQCFIEPMLEIVPLSTPLPDLSKYQALAFTSAQGVRVLAARTDDRSLQVYAVGEATANAAREAGFKNIVTADGDLGALNRLLMQVKAHDNRPVLHVCGIHTAGEVIAKEFTVERLPLYEAKAADTLSADCLEALDEGAFDVALFFSPRTGRTFAELLQKYGRTQAAASINALCLSDSVVESVESLPWRSVRAASTPDMAGITALLESDNFMTDSQNQGALRDAGRIIERFGGIRPMASKMAVPVTTVQGWKKRDIIPENRREDVLRAAVVNNIDLSDLIEKQPAANENTGAPSAQGAGETSAPLPLDAPLRRPAEPDNTPEVYDDSQLMAWIKRAEKRAVQKTALVAVFLLSMLMIFVLFPGQRHIAQLEQQIRADEANMKSGSVPSDVLSTIRQLQEQVETLQKDLDASAKRIDALTGMNNSPVNPGLLVDRVTKLEQQVAVFAGPAGLQELSDRIKAMEKTPDGGKTLATAIDALSSLASATQDSTQLDTVLQHAPQGNTTLEQLFAGVPPADIKQGVLLLVSAQLRQALDHGMSVIEDVVLLQKILGNENSDLNTAVAKFAPDAAQTVTPLPQLSDELAALAPSIVKASLQGHDVSAIDKAKASLGSLVEVRKDGNLISGTDVQAALDRAQQFLKDGNIADALKEIGSLPPDEQNLAQSFVAKAKVTLEAREVSDLLIQRENAGAPAKAQQNTDAEPASANH